MMATLDPRPVNCLQEGELLCAPCGHTLPDSICQAACRAAFDMCSAERWLYDTLQRGCEATADASLICVS